MRGHTLERFVLGSETEFFHIKPIWENATPLQPTL